MLWSLEPFISWIPKILTYIKPHMGTSNLLSHFTMHRHLSRDASSWFFFSRDTSSWFFFHFWLYGILTSPARFYISTSYFWLLSEGWLPIFIYMWSMSNWCFSAMVFLTNNFIYLFFQAMLCKFQLEFWFHLKAFTPWKYMMYTMLELLYTYHELAYFDALPSKFCNLINQYKLISC
jgi:hypothetical protein